MQKRRKPRATEITTAKAKINEIMREYGFTVTNLKNNKTAKLVKAKVIVEPQFINPVMGKSGPAMLLAGFKERIRSSFA